MKSGGLNLLESSGPVQACNGIAFNRRNANWMGPVLRTNCLLHHIVEGRVEGGTEVTQRLGRRCKQLLDYLKGERGYCKLKEEALDRAVWRTRSGRADGPVVRMVDESGTPIVASSGQLGRSIALLFVPLPTEDAVVFFMSHNVIVLSTRQTQSL
jgi:hypothetical protein